MSSTQAAVRQRIVVRGVVQGVGFRPHVARLAKARGLVGWCRNDASGLVVEVEGAAAQVDDFRERLVAEPPPLALILDVSVAPCAPVGEPAFTIAGSSAATGVRTLVAPDVATCADCLAELVDPLDRRYRHPFITCTNCGPRFSITLDVPYDRPATTMADFAMCARCEREYADPADRRYHAQPIACRDCGPVLSFVRPGGEQAARELGEDALAAAVRALAAGEIIAIKGVGGYHLACDATRADAVARLRARKQRPAQPFAVMVPDLRSARRIVQVPPGADALLRSPARPVVLLPVLSSPSAPAGPAAPVGEGAAVAEGVAPGLDELGVLLPYTPLHHLVLADLWTATGRPPVLVLTSGNLSGEPLCYRDDDALARLAGIADGFLGHDRPIAYPVDDSVVAWSGEAGVGVPIRRSRGYAPLPVDVGVGDGVAGVAGGARAGVVLAAGAELKNTVCLAMAASDGGATPARAFLSAHVGDLESLPSREAQVRVADSLVRFHRATPDLVAADQHPGYASRAWAQQAAAARGIRLLEVQHHHAHLAALAAEHNRMDRPLLGWVLDGTGYACGRDGAGEVWGCELLLLGDQGCSAERLGSLGPVRLPGGDAGVRNPVRTAAIALWDAGIDPGSTALAAELSPAEAAFLASAQRTGEGLVATSSAGRLFDVVSALLGLRPRVSYEAQAAIELEAAAARWRRTNPEAAVPELALPHTNALLDPGPLVRAIVAASPGSPAGSSAGSSTGSSTGALAYAFHLALADACADAAASVAGAHGLDTVGLSGGVFVNRILLHATRQRLEARGLEVLTHQQVPANDGGLALGQAAIGLAHLAHSPSASATATAGGNLSSHRGVSACV